MSMISYMASSTKNNANLRKRTKDRYLDARENKFQSENIYKYVEPEISEEERKALDLKIQEETKRIKIRTNLIMFLAFGLTLFLTISLLIWMI